MKQEQRKTGRHSDGRSSRRSICGRGHRRRRTTGTRPRKARAVSTRKRIRGAGQAAEKRPCNRVQFEGRAVQEPSSRTVRHGSSPSTSAPMLEHSDREQGRSLELDDDEKGGD